MKVLVDGSVWIDHLRGMRTRETGIFDRLLACLDPKLRAYDEGTPPDLLICDLILCEALRGIPDARQHAAVKGDLAELRGGDDRRC
jgi:hypothetical protein